MSSLVFRNLIVHCVKDQSHSVVNPVKVVGTCEVVFNGLLLANLGVGIRNQVDCQLLVLVLSTALFWNWIN